MSLLKECIEALSPQVKVLEEQQSKEIFELLQANFPFTNWGRIDWGKQSNREELNETELASAFPDGKCFLLWNDASLPVLQASLEGVQSFFEDVVAVSFDTWILSIDGNCVIEHYHDGAIKIGVIEDENQ